MLDQQWIWSVADLRPLRAKPTFSNLFPPVISDKIAEALDAIVVEPGLPLLPRVIGARSRDLFGRLRQLRTIGRTCHHPRSSYEASDQFTFVTTFLTDCATTQEKRNQPGSRREFRFPVTFQYRVVRVHEPSQERGGGGGSHTYGRKEAREGESIRQVHRSLWQTLAK